MPRPRPSARRLRDFAREFGVDDMASLFDELLEVDPELSLETYRERIGLARVDFAWRA